MTKYLLIPSNEEMERERENNYRSLLLKVERFCAYRERCCFEVLQKLQELDANEEEKEKVLASLKEDDYLNEERFAKLFTSGKFRMKRWGKNKIRAELRMKKVPDKYIVNGLNTISDDDYLKTLLHLIQKKERELKSKDPKNKKQKIGMYLLSKGYESELIWKNIK